MENKELLEHYRDQIDTIDMEMIYLLSRRFEIVKQIGLLKKDENMPVLQMGRWDNVMHKLLEEAKERMINPKLIEDIWNRIHQEALKLEK